MKTPILTTLGRIALLTVCTQPPSYREDHRRARGCCGTSGRARWVVYPYSAGGSVRAAFAVSINWTSVGPYVAAQINIGPPWVPTGRVEEPQRVWAPPE